MMETQTRGKGTINHGLWGSVGTLDDVNPTRLSKWSQAVPLHYSNSSRHASPGISSLQCSCTFRHRMCARLLLHAPCCASCGLAMYTASSSSTLLTLLSPSCTFPFTGHTSPLLSLWCAFPSTGCTTLFTFFSHNRHSVMNIKWDYSYYQPWSDNEWLVDEMIAIREETLMVQNENITMQ